MAGSSDPGSHRNFEAEPGDAAYGRLVDAVSLDVEAWLGRSEGDVIVLAPCGCSRTELLKRLMNELKGSGELLFSKAYAYKGFRRKAGAPQGVDEYASLEELVGKLKEWSGGRVAVVPESSCEAVALKQMLEKEAPNLRVQLLYLPQLYSEAAQGYSEEVRELAKVEHTELGRAYKVKAEGLSSKLLRTFEEVELRELVLAKHKLLSLSIGKLGFGDYLKEFVDKIPSSLVAAPVSVFVALAVERVLEPIVKLGLNEVAFKLLENVSKMPSRQIEKAISSLLEILTKPAARNKVAAGIAMLAETAKQAAPYLDRDELETVVDQVALEWGMSPALFKNYVRNLAKMLTGEVVTREELYVELVKEKQGLFRKLAPRKKRKRGVIIWEEYTLEHNALQSARALQELSQHLYELAAACFYAPDISAMRTSTLMLLIRDRLAEIARELRK